jgi:AcrR family transcriptional regulator
MALLKIKQSRSLERRRTIIAAATKVFGQKGVHAATLTDIGREAGVPLSSLYDYFADKVQLLASLPGATFEEFYAHVDTLLAAARDPHQKLRIFYIETLRYIEHHPAWARVFFLEIWPSVLVTEPDVRAAVDGFGRRVIEIIKQGITEKQLAPENDPYLLMSIILGSMTHIVAVWLLYGQPYHLTTQGERTLALLLPILISRSRGRKKTRLVGRTR